MFVICDCGYESDDVDSIHILKEVVYEDGGNYNTCECPNCNKKTLVT